MNTREDILLNHTFFIDKPSLAEQIVNFEKNGHGYLPNSFSYKVLEPGDITENYKNKFTLGRIHTYYFISFENSSNATTYQCFENDSKLITFITDQAAKSTMNDDEELESELNMKKIVAYWLNKIEKLA